MDLIELAEEAGLSPTRVAQTYGGEYVCSCPKCGDGGKGIHSDRFHLWPKQATKNCMGRYWCRQCDTTGDAIQFCRDILGLSYVDACSKLKVAPKQSRKYFVTDLTKPRTKLGEATMPNSTWQTNASAFVDECHNMLWKHPKAVELLKARGFNEESIRRWKLGYCHQELTLERSKWGLSDKRNSEGGLVKLWLPKGIVIPTFLEGFIVKLKIRRTDEPKIPSVKFKKYIVIPGSMAVPTMYGDSKKPILIMESEFDALLTFDAIGDICSVVALGGAQMKPDLQLHLELRKSPKILLSLDYDEAGLKSNTYWRLTYPQLLVRPVPKGKSPGDALKLGVDLKQWVARGLQPPNG
ncbi:MAG: hypothetical protein LLF94_08970 [Chlamydiales bacterium]|nr:hypothetical protein [Chlamydiales bacterium]